MLHLKISVHIFHFEAADNCLLVLNFLQETDRDYFRMDKFPLRKILEPVVKTLQFSHFLNIPFITENVRNYRILEAYNDSG